jgi:hypothetical protein
VSPAASLILLCTTHVLGYHVDPAGSDRCQALVVDGPAPQTVQIAVGLSTRSARANERWRGFERLAGERHVQSGDHEVTSGELVDDVQPRPAATGLVRFALVGGWNSDWGDLCLSATFYDVSRQDPVRLPLRARPARLGLHGRSRCTLRT